MLLVPPPSFFAKTWTPLSFGTSLAAWYDASDAATITQAAGLASQWNDKSGKSAPPLTAATTARPTYSATSYQQNAAGLSFDGVANIMTAANFALPGPFSVFVFGQVIPTIPGTSNNTRLVSYVANGDTGDFGSLASAAIIQKSGDAQGISSVRNFAQSSILLDQGGGGIYLGTDYISIASVWDGANSTLYYDNWGASTPTAYTGNLGPLGTLLLGGGNNTFWKSTIAEVIILNKAASAADRLNIQRWFQRRWTRIIGVDGDSIAQGNRNLGTHYTQLYMPNATPVVPYMRDFAIGGSRLQTNPGDLIFRTAATDARGPGLGGAFQTILFVGIGANDQGYNTSGTENTGTVYANAISNYCAARKAAGWKKVVIQTILSRTDVLQNDIWRNNYNTIIRNPAWQAANSVDAVVDFASDAIMGVDSAPTVNPTFFDDQVHPSATGYARMEPYFRATMNALV